MDIIAVPHVNPRYRYEDPRNFRVFVSCLALRFHEKDFLRDVQERFLAGWLSFDDAQRAVKMMQLNLDEATKNGRRYSVIYESQKRGTGA